MNSAPAIAKLISNGKIRRENLRLLLANRITLLIFPVLVLLLAVTHRHVRLCALKNLTNSADAQSGYTCPPLWNRALTGACDEEGNRTQQSPQGCPSFNGALLILRSVAMVSACHSSSTEPSIRPAMCMTGSGLVSRIGGSDAPVTAPATAPIAARVVARVAQST